MTGEDPLGSAGRGRIVFVTQPTAGGVGVCVRKQVEFATLEGYDTILISPAVGDGPLAGVDANRIELEMQRQPGPVDLRQILELRRLFEGAGIVHLHSSKAGALGRLAAMSMRPSRRPAVIFTPHAWSWLVGGRLAALYKLVERGLAGVADTIVAVSSGEAAEGRRVLGPRPNIEVIANGVDLDRFTPAPNSNTRQHRPLLVCVGRLARQKGQDVAIRALARLEVPGAILRLVGSGETQPELEELARELGVDDRIQWVPDTPDTSIHLQQADVVLVPSRWDGMSLVLLEAMASGAAVVATNVAGTEAVRDGIVVVEPDEPDAMAREVSHLLSHHDERQVLEKRARAVAENFDLTRSLEATAELWQDALAKGS